MGSSASRSIDVRVIAATWRDLEGNNGFRHDLYQRLNILPIQLKPLRSRPDAVGPLLEFFLSERRALQHWPPEPLLTELVQASWRGNIRELRNRAIRCACTANTAELRPDEGEWELRVPRRGASLTSLTDERIRRILASHRGNRSATARELGISRSTLYRRLQRSG